ncbi:DNA-3-methyladenine glycosylase [Streptococcus sp. OH4692_COT-348]|nr:DNA-3-methyladenine glycosylase [Streptococcus sp. OH4692_COT-348]
METFIISILTSFIVTSTMMHYHIYKVNELYEKYMDFETSSVKKFSEDIISKLPKNSSQEE